MRVLSVAPREADTVGSLKVCRGGTAVGETREEGGSFNFNFSSIYYQPRIQFHMFKDEIKRKLNVAGDIFPFTLNMLSRKKTVICGIKRVVSTSDTHIKMRLDSGNMSIDGENLHILEIGGGDMFLEGQVDKIEFEKQK